MVNVVKRNGNKEKLNLEKIHKVCFWACEGINNVSPSEIELKASLNFSDGIETSNIQDTLIKSAAELISEDNPGYAYVAGRLVNYALRKEVYNYHEPTDLYNHVQKVVKDGYYDPLLLIWYSREEYETLNSYIDHNRDFNIAYAGMEQMRGKYLVKNRVTGKIYETPNMSFMLIGMALFKDYENRLKWIKDFYDSLSTFEISLPTPIMAGVRTPQKQWSSCVLIQSDDSLESISATSAAIVKYVSQRAGIGIGAGRIRAIGSKIRNGDTSHTGVIPFYKLFSASVNSCSQGSIRQGAATLYVQIWHYEIEDILVLKNNKGTEDNRVRRLDYGIQFNRLMYERLLSGGNITLFSPQDVPEVYEAFFADAAKFKELYEKAERNPKIRKKVVPAIKLFSAFMQERKDTGRIYLMNVDHANDHGSFIAEKAPIYMSNLCCLSGDTYIWVKDKNGVHGTIQLNLLHRLSENGSSNLQVLSHNFETGMDEYRDILAIKKTRKNAEVIKITYANNKFDLVCTPDHPIYTKNRGYVEAGKLTLDDQLMLYNNDMVTKPVIQIMETKQDVYDIQVDVNANFYANCILVHNCEITLPNKPLNDINDENGRISLCTLGAINAGKIKHAKDFEKPCELIVRALDSVLDEQTYPIKASELDTMERRPLGIGIMNFAYWLAKNDLDYQNIDEEGLAKIHEFAEAWSYYLLKASVKLAKEKGACPLYNETKYSQGLLPIDTYKKEVDELTNPKLKMDWEGLRKDMKEYGIRHSTLMALMPGESSSQVSNATNGIEPPRALVSVKQSKDGILKQVVPEVRKLKNKYDLLWDQQSPEGYLKICAVLQKFIDQAISVNTSYNPKFFENNEIPMSVLTKDLILMYKWGLKTAYYFNTNDNAGETDVALAAAEPEDQDSCDSCKI